MVPHISSLDNKSCLTDYLIKNTRLYLKTILLLTISIRFIPRRIDLDCDFALDMLVTENLQFNSHVISTNKEAIISIEQQQRHEKRTNQNKQTNSAKKT